MLDLMEIRILEPSLGEDIGLGAIGYLKEDLTLRELAEKTKESYNVPQVRVYGGLDEIILKVAVLPGSGSSGINYACMEGCDVLITGDIGHHDGIDALEKGISIIDAGHFGMEKLFAGYMQLYIQKTMPELNVTVDRVQQDFHII